MFEYPGFNTDQSCEKLDGWKIHSVIVHGNCQWEA